MVALQAFEEVPPHACLVIKEPTRVFTNNQSSVALAIENSPQSDRLYLAIHELELNEIAEC